jgi:hypothetical protein
MHPKVLSAPAWELVADLSSRKLLEDWTLGGGTGLALQFGHRLSADLDFFRFRPSELDHLPGRLSDIAPLEILDRAAGTLHVRVGGIRLSFLGLEVPLLHRGIHYRGFTVGDVRDIAALKLVALGGRGSRKDFIDLYFYLRQTPGLDQLFEHLERRDPGIDWNRFHLLKSLTFFEDAEQEPMPRMLKKVDWTEVKRYFEATAVRYL